MTAGDMAHAICDGKPEPTKEQIARVVVETFVEVLRERGELTFENVERECVGFVDGDVRPYIRAALNEGTN